MNIQLDENVIVKAITDSVLTQGAFAERRNPVVKALTVAFEDSAPTINQLVVDCVREVCAEPDFRERVKETMRKSLIAEADAMGKKAARAAVNAMMDLQ